MKKGFVFFSVVAVLLSFTLFLSCKPVTPVPEPSGSRQAPQSVASTPSPEPSPVTKPATFLEIWWGPKPQTTEQFMKDLKRYYPDWYRWFTLHPEEIENYFQPDASASPPPVSDVSASAPPPKKADDSEMLTFRGLIMTFDMETKTIEVGRKRRSMVFAFTPDTKVTQAGKEIAWASIEQGMSVLIEYKMDGNRMLATGITVSPPSTRSERGRQRK